MNDLSIITYLKNLTNDIFKILPMKENADVNGEHRNLRKYIETLTINLLGGLSQFEALGKEKQYIYAITNLRFLMNNEASYEQWRRTILTAVSGINFLYKKYGGSNDE